MKRNNEQYGGGVVLIFVGPFVIAQLALPTQSPRLGRDLFGFGDQTFLLVKNRQARVGQFIIGRNFDKPLARFDRFVKFFLVRVGHRQCVQRVRIVRVFVERTPISRDRGIQLVLGK